MMQAVGGPGLSAAKEAASRANPSPPPPPLSHPFSVSGPQPMQSPLLAPLQYHRLDDVLQAIGGPGLSAAQEAASRANPPPFDPAVIGGTAGILLLAFGIGTGRADPQLKMNSSSGSSSSGGGSSSGEHFQPFSTLLHPQTSILVACAPRPSAQDEWQQRQWWGLSW